MEAVSVACCALNAAERKLLEIVLSTHRPEGKPRYAVWQNDNNVLPVLAIADANNADSCAIASHLRYTNPAIVTVWISDDGTEGNGNHHLQRRFMLVQILRSLDAALNPNACTAAPTSHSLHHGGVSALERTHRNHLHHAIAPPKPLAPPVRAEIDSAFVSAATTTPAASVFQVLIVDDSATARAQAREAIERLGYAVHEADSAETAMKLLESKRFELCLLDVTMPGMNGFDLCSQLKHKHELDHMPIVMLTSRSLPFDRAKGVFSRCDGYLTKPIDFPKFQATVQNVLRLYAGRRARTQAQHTAGSLMAAAALI